MARPLRLLTAALLATLHFAASAQNSAAQKRSAPPPPLPATGRISGTVICSDTHRPARGAIVAVNRITQDGNRYQRGDEMGKTAMDGTYTLQHLAPGEYIVMAFLPGYSLPFSDEQFASMMSGDQAKSQEQAAKLLGTVSVHNGETLRMDLSLVRGAAFSGQVLYSDGSPASQVSISIADVKTKPIKRPGSDEEVNVGAMMRRIFSHQSLNTDDLGRFRVSGLAPGTYRVAAVQKLSAAVDRGSEFSELGLSPEGIVNDPAALHVYAGDTLHLQAAKQFEVRDGDEISGINITIPLDSFHKVGGTLQATDGRKISMGKLSLTDTTDSDFGFTAAVHPDGTFEFPAVPAGTYTLSATKARIGVAKESDMGIEGIPLTPKFAFADASVSIVVKEVDTTDNVVSLKEIPVPADKVHAPGNPVDMNR